MLAASDFKSDSNQERFFRYWGGNSNEPAEGSSGIGISAAVHLPQGAHVTKLTAYYADTDPTSAPLVDLYRGITDSLQLIGILSSALPDNSFAAGEDVRSVTVSGAAAASRRTISPRKTPTSTSTRCSSATANAPVCFR
jgi:hypothetical protein